MIENILNLRNNSLKLNNKLAFLTEFLLIMAGVFVPMLTHHFFGMQAAIMISPVHWFVIFATLTYGLAGGLAVAIVSPVLSFMFTGLPMPMILIAMLGELSVYAILIALFKTKFNFVTPLAIALSLVIGKFVYTMIFGFLQLNADNGFNFITFYTGLLIGSIVLMFLQIIILPVLSNLWITFNKK